MTERAYRHLWITKLPAAIPTLWPSEHCLFSGTHTEGLSTCSMLHLRGHADLRLWNQPEGIYSHLGSANSWASQVAQLKSAEESCLKRIFLEHAWLKQTLLDTASCQFSSPCIQIYERVRPPCKTRLKESARRKNMSLKLMCSSMVVCYCCIPHKAVCTLLTCVSSLELVVFHTYRMRLHQIDCFGMLLA